MTDAPRLADPAEPHPIRLPDGTPLRGTVHLAAAPLPPGMEVGAHSYASDHDPPETLDGWAPRLAPYLFPFSRERLVIGRFCQIAHGVRFVTASASHATDGLSCYPFAVFDAEARVAMAQPDTRDTVIGSDVWIGTGAMLLPGARVGHGAIVGAGAVVRGAVPPYAIVAGNPAEVVRHRFDEATVARLLALAWWDWSDAAVEAAIPAISAGDVDALEALAPGRGVRPPPPSGSGRRRRTR